MEIIVDDLTGSEIIALLQQHLHEMYATSPPESVHALDINRLKAAEITFFSAWKNNQLVGCVAIKELTPTHGELKSMRTATSARNSGVASKLLQHALNESQLRGYHRLSLETGAQAFFQPARTLYEKFGFGYCAPFADYEDDPHSKFMTISLK